MNEERISYNEIRSGFMSCFYDYRRNMVKDSQRKNHVYNMYDEIGYAHYQWENAYVLPIEILMRDVFTLIMQAGCNSDIVAKNLRQGIRDTLDKHPLDFLLQGVSEDEKSDLLYDMELLGLIGKRAE